MTNDVKEQIKEFTRLIEKYPAIHDFYFFRGTLYERIKEYQKAMEDYKKMLPTRYFCINMAKICEENGLIEEAEYFYTKEINEDKNNTFNYISRILFYIHNKEIEKAILDCKSVLEISPTNEMISTLKKILIGRI